MESEHISRFVFNKFGEDAKRRFYAPTVTNGMQLLCDKLRVGVNLIAGRPRMGCSSLAISMAVALAKQGRRVLFVTAHRQGFYSQISRNLAVEFGLDASKCSDLTAYDAEMSKIKEPIEKLPIRHMGMYYDWQDDYLSLRSLLRGEKRRNDMQYIFIDCLQDMSADSRLLNGLTQEEYLCRNFRSLADELDVPIIAVTRLNNGPARRGGIEGTIPLLCDFRGGDLAAYATNVFFAHRPEYFRIYTDKNGEGLRGTIFVYAIGTPYAGEEKIRFAFDGKNARVYDPTNDPWAFPVEVQRVSSFDDLPF